MKDTYLIEKHVPRPRGSGRYPFADMEVGDSFFISEKSRGEAARVAARNFKIRNAPEWAFSTRKEGTGLRLWRVR